MRLVSYTIGGIEAASSRLRSFYLFSDASKYGLEVVRPKSYAESLRGDVVQIQKLISFKIILLILILRLKKIKIIFDIDDQPISRKQFFKYWLAMMFASVVTTDTKARKSYWDSFIDPNKIKVIPDVADSEDQILSVFDRSGVKIDPKKLFWVGYAANFPSIVQIGRALSKDGYYSFVASVQLDKIDSMRQLYPEFEFVPWSETIVRDKRIDAKFMILNHDYTQEHKYKSENKMVLAILAGFIPIVSRTPAYESLAKELKAEYLLFDGIHNVAEVLRGFEKIDEKAFFENAIKYIVANYSSDMLLARYLNEVIS